MAAHKLPDQAYLREHFDYNPETGILRWRKRVGRCGKGTIAGCAEGRYLRIFLDGKRYQAHRIAWKIMVGTDPGDIIDHKDNNPFNNSWDNLREATVQQNQWNASVTKSKSGHRGVYYHKGKRNPYRVQIVLGSFRTLEEAADVWKRAAAVLHGEFLR